MKKTLIALLSILLIAFAFTACDNGNKGPAGPTEEEQKAADELATEYMNSINYGELIVQAFNGENTSTLTLSEKSKDGFRIEFTDYKGSALQKATDSEIASIASGAIDFTFSKTTATTTSAKATVADYNTYTATTVDEKPLKFMKADGETAVGGDFAFTITGKASISFDTTGTGTSEKIEKLTEGTKIDINVPNTATLKVGAVEVSYDTIKKDVTVSGGAEVKDPFTQEEAQTALVAVLDSISKTRLSTDLKNGLDRAMGNGGADVIGVKFDSLTSVYNGKDLNQETTIALLKALMTSGQTLANENSEITALLEGFNILNLKITLKAHFAAENGNYYTSGLHTGTGADQTGVESKVASINAGNIEITILPSAGDLQNKTISGLYTLSADDVEFAMKSGVADSKYTISFDDLVGTFSLGSNDVSTKLPPRKATHTITIANAVEPQDVKWDVIAPKLGEGTGFASDKDIQDDAKAFYQHFGTKKFLIALNEAFDKPSKEISIGTESIAITDNSFTLPVTFTNYQYHTKFGNQLVSGTVNFTFTGTVEEGDSSTFKATNFAVSTEKDKVLNLSDKAGLRPDATVSFSNNGGTIGNGDDGNVVFEVGGDTEKTITGITDYSGDGAYTKANEFVLTGGITSVEIEF